MDAKKTREPSFEDSEDSEGSEDGYVSEERITLREPRFRRTMSQHHIYGAIDWLLEHGIVGSTALVEKWFDHETCTMTVWMKMCHNGFFEEKRLNGEFITDSCKYSNKMKNE